jgi:hypothetical protein
MVEVTHVRKVAGYIEEEKKKKEGKCVSSRCWNPSMRPYGVTI